MSSENKHLVRRFFLELWNQRKLAVADEIFASNYTLVKAIRTVVTLVMYILFLCAFMFFVLWMVPSMMGQYVEDEYFWDAAVLAVAGCGLGVFAATLKGRTKYRVKRTKPKSA